MLIGEIEGTVSTSEFKFRAYTEVKKFDFVAVKKNEQWILSQVQEVKKYEDGKTEAQTSVIGYREKRLLRKPKSAVKPNSMVYSASQELISDTLGLDERGLYIGKLESNRHVKIHLDPDAFFKHLAILAQTGAGKCVSGKTPILMNDGELKNIRSIFDENKDAVIEENDEETLIKLNGCFVCSLDKNLKLKKSQASYAYRKKCDKILCIKTSSGREIEVSKEHPLLTIQKDVSFRPAAYLKEGDFIAIPRKMKIDSKVELELPTKLAESNERIVKEKHNNELIYSKVMKLREKGYSNEKICNLLGISEKSTIDKWIYEKSEPLETGSKNVLLASKFSKGISYPREMTKNFAGFLALVIADSIKVNKDGFRIIFTNYDEELLNRFAKFSKELFDLKAKKLSSHAKYVDSSSLQLFLKNIGYSVNKYSGNEKIPNCILHSNMQCKKEFLKTFYDCEGCVEEHEITLTTASKQIANDILYLLLNFNIIAGLRTKFKRATNSKHAGNWYYEISISGASNLFKFLENIGFSLKRKQEKLKAISRRLKENTNVDVIPNMGLEIYKARTERKLSQKKLGDLSGMSDRIIYRYESENKNPSRVAIKKMSEVLESKKISVLANSDVLWDPIEEIIELNTDDGYVYDLGVEDTHTFIAGIGGIIAHNSYMAGVVCEELLDKKYPLLIIDPHGEYNSLAYKNKISAEQKEKFEITPNSYNVEEYTGESGVNTEAKMLSFSELNLSAQDIVDVLPTHLTNSQLGILYTVIRELEGKNYYLNDILSFCTASESKAKWGLINMLEMLKKTGLFSQDPPNLKKLIKKGQATIVNLKGVPPKTQEVIVHLLAKNLFDLRKRGEIDPFLMLIEEAHNFIPERNIGKAACSNTLMTIASEGRKFGLGLIVVSQRPARIDNNILSQCNTQVILRLTNPSDLNAISRSFEGITKSVKGAIRGLPSGVGLVLGKDYPIMTEVRTRRTRHGGETKTIAKETKMLKTFAPNYSREFFEKKLRENMKEVYYPLWVLTANNQKIVLDGKNGELKYRSPNLSPKELEVLNLIGLKPRTKNELIEKLGISFSDLSALLDYLVSQKYVQRNQEGEKTYYHAKKDPFSSIKNVEYHEAKLLEIEIKKDKAIAEGKKLAKNEIDDAEIIYYPYYATQKAVVDAITGKQM